MAIRNKGKGPFGVKVVYAKRPQDVFYYWGKTRDRQNEIWREIIEDTGGIISYEKVTR